MFGGNVKQEQATLPVHTSKLAIRNPFKNAELKNVKAILICVVKLTKS